MSAFQEEEEISGRHGPTGRTPAGLLAEHLSSEELVATLETIWEKKAQGKIHVFTRSCPEKKKRGGGYWLSPS